MIARFHNILSIDVWMLQCVCVHLCLFIQPFIVRIVVDSMTKCYLNEINKMEKEVRSLELTADIHVYDCDRFSYTIHRIIYSTVQ